MQFKTNEDNNTSSQISRKEGSDFTNAHVGELIVWRLRKVPQENENNQEKARMRRDDVVLLISKKKRKVVEKTHKMYQKR